MGTTRIGLKKGCLRGFGRRHRRPGWCGSSDGGILAMLVGEQDEHGKIQYRLVYGFRGRFSRSGKVGGGDPDRLEIQRRIGHRAAKPTLYSFRSSSSIGLANISRSTPSGSSSLTRPFFGRIPTSHISGSCPVFRLVSCPELQLHQPQELRPSSHPRDIPSYSSSS